MRHICAEQPDLWPQALLQMALFVGRNKPYVQAQQDVEAWRVGGAAKSWQLKQREQRTD